MLMAPASRTHTMPVYSRAPHTHAHIHRQSPRRPSAASLPPWRKLKQQQQQQYQLIPLLSQNCTECGAAAAVAATAGQTDTIIDLFLNNFSRTICCRLFFSATAAAAALITAIIYYYHYFWASSSIYIHHHIYKFAENNAQRCSKSMFPKANENYRNTYYVVWTYL